MKFDEWMFQQGLSESSVLKYAGAVRGPLSDWATEAGLLNKSILDIRDRSTFDTLVQQIKKLPAFVERNSTGHAMYSSALKRYAEFLDSSTGNSLEDDVERIVTDRALGPTQAVSLITSRIGQGKFRQQLIKHWGQCAVTGYKELPLLLASHIKPWTKSTDHERLDVYNGLLLMPNIDCAFDQGYISFSEAGSILVSSQLGDPLRLGIKEGMSVDLSLRHQKYMDYHREHVYKG